MTDHAPPPQTPRRSEVRGPLALPMGAECDACFCLLSHMEILQGRCIACQALGRTPPADSTERTP